MMKLFVFWNGVRRLLCVLGRHIDQSIASCHFKLLVQSSVRSACTSLGT